MLANLVFLTYLCNRNNEQLKIAGGFLRLKIHTGRNLKIHGLKITGGAEDVLAVLVLFRPSLFGSSVFRVPIAK